jgi:hypothetical protein
MEIFAKRLLTALSLVGIASWSHVAVAAENGETHANLGYLDFLAGFEPPPGFYFRDDVIGVPSTSLNDKSGNSVKLGGVVPVNFRSDTIAEIATFYYVSPLQIGGGNFATAVLVPFKNQDVSLGNPLTGTARSNVTGLGDIIVVPQLGWHLPQWNLHVTVGPAFYLPTGEYNPNDPVADNIGHNFLTVEPQVNITYLNKTGQEISLAFAYDFNFANPATNYIGGQEFSVNYAIAQHLNQAWTAGVAGYYYIQVTDDTRNGNVVFSTADQLAGHPDLFNNGLGNRGEVFAIGPAVSYNYLSKFTIELKWEHELFAANRQRGDQVWGRISLPLAPPGKG